MREYVRKCRSKLTSERKKYLNQYYCRSWVAWIGRHTHAALVEDRLKDRVGNITPDDIMSMLEANKYCCALTNLSLRHDKSLWSMSIDRIDNSIGHTVDNIQLVCIGINLAKNRHSNMDVAELLKLIGNPTEFEPHKISRDYISTCVRNSRLRDVKVGIENDIDTDFVIDLLNRDNRCYFTGIKVACYNHPILSISLDRVNNSLGHVKENVRIVLKAINRAKKDRSDNEVVEWLDDIRRHQATKC